MSQCALITRKSALITGARSAAALELSRHFHAVGWDVHVADCSSAYICRWSKSVEKFHRYPSPVTSPEDFQMEFAKLVDNVQPDIVVPTCEEVFHLAAPNLRNVSHHFFQPPLAKLRQLHDKSAFAALCGELDLPVPESYILQSRVDLYPFKRDSGNWVFKKCFSRFGDAVLIAPDADMLEHLKPSVESPWLAQRRVDGTEASFYAIANGGVLKSFSAYTSDWRLEGGASYVFNPASPEILGALTLAAKTLAAHLNLTGQFSGDAIVDENRKAWLIECNPRATSGVHLISGMGQLAKSILGEAELQIHSNSPPAYLLPALSFFGLPSAFRHGKLGYWWQMLRDGRDAIGQKGDRLPLVGAVLDSVLFSLSALRNGITTTAATTADIEWNGGPLR